MFGDIKGSVAYLGTAMNLRVQRQQVIASNIANADTPYYKAKDFDFSSALRDAMAGRASASDVQLSKTSSRHMDGVGGNTGAALKYRTEKQSAVDGNTVDMDVERAAMAENSMHYELLTKLVSDHFSELRTAVSSPQS